MIVVFFFFKQKTAYEMLRSLVGSEMCIRDSPWYILWGGLLFAMTESGQLARRIVVWATCGLAMYSVVDAAWRSSVVAVGVTAALALVWITTGHDRDLIRDKDFAKSRRTPA